MRRPFRFSHSVKPIFWLLWLVLISSPLVFVRLNYDSVTRTWNAALRVERWRGLWHDVPAWVAEHAEELLITAVVAALVVVAARMNRRPEWTKFRSAATRGVCSWPLFQIGWLRCATAVVTVLITLILASLLLENTQLEWAVMACTYIVLAMGLNLTVGMAGLLVLGYAGFVGVGAYTFALMNEWLGVNLWLAIVPAMALGGTLGFVLGLPSIRLRGDYLAIVTLGFGETVRFLIKNFIGEQSITFDAAAGVPELRAGNLFWDGLGHVPLLGKFSRWLFPDGLTQQRTELWVVVAMVVISILLIRNLMRSRIGRAWVAIREDETAAAAMGIPTVRMKLLAFSLSAVWAAAAGVFFVAHNTSANPEMFTFEMSVLILSMVVLGGMGGLWGPIVGALVLYLMPEILRERFPTLITYRPMIVGALMVAMMIFRPQGLLGGLRQRLELGGEPGVVRAEVVLEKQIVNP